MMADLSTMAELWAIRDGLKFALMENINRLEVETDALAASQLLSAKNIDNHLLSNVIFECRSLMQRFDSFTINHIFREANKCADALASDTPVSVGEFSTIFTFCIVLLISYMQNLLGWNTQEMYYL